MMDDFPNGAAFVLGGSGGIGSGICAAFARAGVPVGLSYNSDAASGDATAGLGADALAFQVDSSNREGVVRLSRTGRAEPRN